MSILILPEAVATRKVWCLPTKLQAKTDDKSTSTPAFIVFYRPTWYKQINSSDSMTKRINTGSRLDDIVNPLVVYLHNEISLNTNIR